MHEARGVLAPGWKGITVRRFRSFVMLLSGSLLVSMTLWASETGTASSTSVVQLDAEDQAEGRIVLAQQQRRALPNRRGQPAASGADTRTPEELSDPDRPISQGAATEPITIDFVDAPLGEVVKMIGAQIGRNFDVMKEISAETVTIIAHEPVPAEMAFPILESILTSRGYEMVEDIDGYLIRIQARGDSPEKLEIGIGDELPGEDFDKPLIRVVQVKYAVAEEVSQTLKLVGSEEATVDVYAPTNSMIMRDTADGVRNMLRLLKEIDLPGSETSLEVFSLEYERAENLATVINEVLVDPAAGAAGGGGRPVNTRPTPRTTVRPAASAPRQSQVIGQREEVLRLVPNERLNALIVVATDTRMGQVRDLIDHLDTHIDYESDNMHIIELLNADAEAVEEALSALTGTSPRAGGQQGGGGGGAGGEVQPFEKTVSITRYEQTNSLLILATPQDFRKIERIIQQLDVPRRQVSVQAVIMEVAVNDSQQLSVELAGLTANDYFALNNVVELAAGIAGGPLALAGIGTTVGILDGTTTITVPTGIDPTTGAPTGTSLQTIPNVPLLMTALETITNVEVLSQPNLLTLDNETSNIIVGQDIPLISSLQDTNSQGLQSRSRIQREEVGVKMEVTPQINEGDYVAMEIKVEVSQPVASTVGIDPNETGATIQKAEVVAQIVVGNGQTGIIGGLLREGIDKTVNQTPILGDLPLLGWLFRNRSNAHNKQNLVILVTPHIVKQGHDLDRITDFRIGEFYRSNVDALFGDAGFIKKIKRKRSLRKNYRPTDQYTLRGGEQGAFGRGDIQR